MKRHRGPLLAVAALGWAIGCDRRPDDLREWQPSDHHHQQEAVRESDPESPQVTGSAEPAMPGLEAVTLAAWSRACMPCHGQFGRGDGPQGPMVHARDLSDPAWQATVTDEQIVTSITRGRGLMPPAALPEDTVSNLVKLVRLMNRDRSAQGGRPSNTAAPAASQ